MRRTIEITGLNGNGTAGVVSVLLPPGFDYLGYNLQAVSGAAITVGDVTEIKETLNSDITRLYSGTDQDNMNKFDRMATAYAAGVGVLRIPSEFRAMKTAQYTYAATRNTMSTDKTTGKAITQIRLEVRQGTATTHRLFVEVDDSTDMGPGLISRITKLEDATSAGEWSGANKISLGTPERRFLRRLFATVDAGTIGATGDTYIKRGNSNSEIFRRNKVLNDRILDDFSSVRLSTGFGGPTTFCLDTTESGISEMMDTMDEVSPNAANAILWRNANADAKTPAVYVQSCGQFDVRHNVGGAVTKLTHLIETVGRF